MIDRNFLRRALFLSLLAFVPLGGTEAATQKATPTESPESGVYARVFNISKLSGESNFMDSGRGRFPAIDSTSVGAAVDKLKDQYLYYNGNVFREFRPTHAFNLVGGGLAIGYQVQGTRFEFEAIANAPGAIADSAEAYFYGLAYVPSYAAGKPENFLGGISYAGVGRMYFDHFAYRAALLNVYQEFDAGDIMKLYLGVGAGVSHVTYNLTDSQKLSSTPFVSQAKIGVTFDVGELKAMGMVPYLGYTALCFAEKQAKEVVTGLGVYRTTTGDATYRAYPKHKFTPVEGVDFVPVAKHLLHNIEFGVKFHLGA